MHESLDGARTVVSGAADGIGRAIVLDFVRRGAVVHGLDRNLDTLMRLDEIVTSDPRSTGRFVPHHVDLADREATDRAITVISTRLDGVCDVLVNNVGVSTIRAFADTDDQLLDTVIAVNFIAAFRITRHFLPALGASKQGVVVNIASELALIGQAGYAAYCASKGAVLAWSRALAVELAPAGIRVNVVCPGPIDTALLEADFAASGDGATARRTEIAAVPLGRLGTPFDIAAVVTFLASNAAAFVTGAAWAVDGGKTAC
jgi:NAD(P)-dependent dehydrogenase (short-subunit alcohol dehydrogenase family)